MKTFTTLGEIPANFGPTAVTVGKFDGIHIGHRRMIERLLTESRKLSLVPTVLTFDRNPLSVFAPEACPPSLVSNAQKLELLAQLGVEATLMMTFDRALREQTAKDFVTSALVDALQAQVVYVGPDFRYGLGGKGDVALMDELGRTHGFEVRHFSNVEREGRRVSSTWVRELLAAGEVREAGRLLGRFPAVRGTIVRGGQRGRTLGYPTANLSQESEGLIPADGVYAAWAIVDGVTHPAAVSIGNKPTFDGVAGHQVEAYPLGTNFEPAHLDLYGAVLEVQFVDRIRGMVAFDNAEELIAGIDSDIERVRALLRLDTEPGR